MSNYRAIVLADTPVSYWRLGEASGTTAVDEQGVNPGTYSGGVTLRQPSALFDDYDFSVNFDGASGQLSIPHSASLEFTTAMTVEVWLRPNAVPSADGEFVIYKQGPPDWALNITGTGSAQWAVVFNVQSDTGSVLSPLSRLLYINSWSYVVGVYTGSLVSLYIDGVLQGVPVAFSDTLSASGLPITVADDLFNAPLFSNVRIDEFAVYNYALTPAQIFAHYQAGVGARLIADPDPSHFPAARGRG
jgi:hypothetical protein